MRKLCLFIALLALSACSDPNWTRYVAKTDKAPFSVEYPVHWYVQDIDGTGFVAFYAVKPKQTEAIQKSGDYFMVWRDIPLDPAAYAKDWSSRNGGKCTAPVTHVIAGKDGFRMHCGTREYIYVGYKGNTISVSYPSTTPWTQDYARMLKSLTLL